MEKNIAKKLLEMQCNLKATKDLKNNFGGFTYRSAESILLACKKLQKDLNVIVTLNDEIFTTSDRTYIKATATLTDADSGESFSTSAFAREQNEKKGMDASQLTGATSSYARKYALCALLAIDDNKDADTDEFRYQTSEEKQRIAAEAEKKRRQRIESARAEMAKATTPDEVKAIFAAYTDIQNDIREEVVKRGLALKAAIEAAQQKAKPAEVQPKQEQPKTENK